MRMRSSVVRRRRVAQHALVSRHEALVHERPLQQLVRIVHAERRRGENRARFDPRPIALARASFAFGGTRTRRRRRRQRRAFVERLRVARQRGVLRAGITLFFRPPMKKR